MGGHMKKDNIRKKLWLPAVWIILALLIATLLISEKVFTASYNLMVPKPVNEKRLRLCDIPGKVCNPLPARTEYQNAFFNKSCYFYHNMTARNTCLRMKDMYNDTGMVSDCLQRLVSQQENRMKKNFDLVISRQVNTSPALRWVIVGDSHMRYIFISLVYSFDKKDLKIRFGNESSSWGDFEKYRTNMRLTIYHTDIHVTHREFPLNITYQWDPFLDRLPKHLEMWQNDSATRPTFLLVGSTLHYIVFKKSMKQYEDKLKIIKPDLLNLASYVPVIYKLGDHIQNIKWPDVVLDSFNNATKQIWKGTEIQMWDSSIPLSDLYNDECRRENRTDDGLRLWFCEDDKHIGYIVINQYTNMILNHVCMNDVQYDDHR